MMLHYVNFKIALNCLARCSKISRRVYTYDANYSRIGAFLQKYGTNLNKTAFDGILLVPRANLCGIYLSFLKLYVILFIGKLDPLVGRVKVFLPQNSASTIITLK